MFSDAATDVHGSVEYRCGPGIEDTLTESRDISRKLTAIEASCHGRGNTFHYDIE
jgi:hypothetical protein